MGEVHIQLAAPNERAAAWLSTYITTHDPGNSPSRRRFLNIPGEVKAQWREAKPPACSIALVVSTSAAAKALWPYAVRHSFVPAQLESLRVLRDEGDDLPPEMRIGLATPIVEMGFHSDIVNILGRANVFVTAKDVVECYREKGSRLGLGNMGEARARRVRLLLERHGLIAREE